MIVDPDFADHWKTRTLVGLLDGDEAAPVYVIRIWAHCQNRRQDTFDNLTPEALKALCRFPGHANKLESSLVASGFIRRNGDTLEVLNWADYNASLLAAWENGKKGGRPPNKPKPPPSKPKGEPTGLRVEKNGEEKKKPPKPPEGVSAFDLFWQVVHVKTGRVAAVRAFARAVKRVAGERSISTADAAKHVTASMAEFAKTPSARPKDRTPIHPTTWLNQGRYDDDRAAWQTGDADDRTADERAKMKAERERLAARQRQKIADEDAAAKASWGEGGYEELAKKISEKKP